MNNPLDKHVIAYQGNSIYDFDNRVILQWYSKRIAELIQNTGSVLELGLGHGYTAEVLSRVIREYFIIEGSPAVIQNYQSRFPDTKINLLESFFEEFTSERTFDSIIMGFVLEHVDDPLAVLKRYKPLLAERGRIFVAVPNAEAMNRRLGQYAGMLPDLHQLSQHDLDLGHKRFYTVASLRTQMEDAGYRVTRMEGIFLKPLTTRQILSLSLDEGIIDGLCRMGMEYPEISCCLLAEGAPQ